MKISAKLLFKGNIKFFFCNIVILQCLSCVFTNDPQEVANVSNEMFYKQAKIFLNQHITKKDQGQKITLMNYLEQDITLALKSCQSELEQGTISFPIFCEYILPPTIYNEPIEYWRDSCIAEFSQLKSLSIEELCDTLNHIFGVGFQFGRNAPSSRTIPWSELKELKNGDCYHMAKTLLYPLRALGIPATIDFVHSWGNNTGAHCWNVVYINGKMEPFMGRESPPYHYDPFLAYRYIPDTAKNVYRYPPKVFRKTFSINTDILDLRKGLELENIPELLHDSRIKDVSDKYFPVSSIHLPYKKDYKEQSLLYLSVYSNRWQPIAAAKIKKNKPIEFTNMKREMLYLPTFYQNHQNKPADFPFFIDDESVIHILKPDFNKRQIVTINYLYPMLMEFLYAYGNSDKLPEEIFDGLAENKYRRTPQEGMSYILYYWDKGDWQRLEQKKTLDNKLNFDIPSNALFHLADQAGKFIGRCFTVKEDEIFWL